MLRIGRLLEAAEAKDRGLLNLEELEPLHTYGFLLSARAQEEITELTTSVVTRVDGAGRQGSDKKLHKKRPVLVPIAAASSAASSAEGSQKRTKSDVDLAMELFM